MREKINQYLIEIEKNYNIEILLACETGSRAWGFESIDSDYDVRIIYKNSISWYISCLVEKKDTIEMMLDENMIDISGWDIRKTLRLLYKSNPPLLEMIQSPILYKVEEKFLEQINSISKNAYSKIATMHHYLSMAKNHYEYIANQKEYKLKRFFYTLRSIIACLWIIQKEENPPISFIRMLEDIDMELKLKDRIYELIDLKHTISESYLHSGEDELRLFIETTIELAILQSKKMPTSSIKLEELDIFLQETLEIYDN